MTPDQQLLLRDAIEVARMVRKASMFETRPSRGESMIGWQRGDGVTADSVREAARSVVERAEAVRG